MAVVCGLWPAPAAALDWSIRDDQVEIEVLQGGALQVRERIEVEFDSPHHGIFRVIPVRYNVRQGFAHDLRLEFEAALDPDGHVLPARVEREGDRVRIRIGDPQRTVTGTRTYVLRYRVRNGVDFHADHDELYWNVTGDEWPVPIQAASVRVRLPAAVPTAEMAYEVYTGAHGAGAHDASLEYADGVFAARTTRPLEAWEGLTVAVGWPKGVVRPPSPAARAGEFLRWNWMLFLPLPVGLWMWRRWRIRGRDPRVGRSVAVQYEPPPGLTPSEVGALVDERADLRDLTAAVVDLAVRGFLRIESHESRFLGLVPRQDFAFVRLAPPGQAVPLKQHETALLDGLFEHGDRVRVEDLRERFYVHLPAVRRGVYAALVRGGLFEASPEEVRRRWRVGGMALLVVGSLLAIGWVQRQGLVSPAAAVPPLLGVAASAAILIAAAGAMPRRTRRGVELTQWSRGLEEFIRRVESPRLETESSAGLDPRRQFERVLPYAMALGVASRWASAFAAVYTSPPAWYVGPPDAAFSSTRFVAGLEHMRGSVAASITAMPRSSSGGGSGLGGGGSSGGGHGGGGGGAW